MTMQLAPDTAGIASGRPARTYLMCPPTHFAVDYAINAWMDPRTPVDRDRAMAEWERLRATYVSLGHTVHLLDPVEDLPDMVFAANGATVVAGRVLLARFRYPQRAPETAAYREWFGARAFLEVRDAELVNEGEGDYLLAGAQLLAGTGFRTDRRSHGEAQELFGRPVISLTLVDPRFYHLDTALAVLDDTVMYYPSAFSPGSRSVLRRLYPDAIIATAADADAFGLNAVCDGRTVILPQAATHLIDELRARGFDPIGVDVSELMKTGGAVKCCTLEIGAA
jgi:N-dimethylarginine dimethylaminohydrolase